MTLRKLSGRGFGATITEPVHEKLLDPDHRSPDTVPNILKEHSGWSEYTIDTDALTSAPVPPLDSVTVPTNVPPVRPSCVNVPESALPLCVIDIVIGHPSM